MAVVNGLPGAIQLPSAFSNFPGETGSDADVDVGDCQLRYWCHGDIIGVSIGSPVRTRQSSRTSLVIGDADNSNSDRRNSKFKASLMVIFKHQVYHSESSHIGVRQDLHIRTPNPNLTSSYTNKFPTMDSAKQKFNEAYDKTKNTAKEGKSCMRWPLIHNGR